MPVPKKAMRSCPHCLTPYTTRIEFCGIDGNRLQSYDVDPLIGKDVDRYRIDAHLGEGAMARVYRATHTVLDRAYAIKVLFGEVAANQVLMERFRREAHAVGKMAHPNIVSIVDFGKTSSGLIFMAMELVFGRTLRWVIRRMGALDPVRAASIARQIADGLRCAHEAGFVHRDIKPGNIMISQTSGKDVAKILDFGLVRAANPDEDEPWLTKTGQFVGTPTYMAPEQITGDEVGPATDLYALGVMAYEMLAGKPPFRAKRIVEMQQQHLSVPPPALSSARGFEKIVFALLEKDPKRRPASAAEVVRLIDDLGLPEPNPADATAFVIPEDGSPRAEAEEDASDHFDLGLALRQLERYDDAIHEFEAAAGAQSLSISSLEQIGHCHLGRGAWREAVQYFERALEAGADGEAATNLKYEIALAYKESGNSAEVIRWFRAAHADDPNHRDVVRELGALGVSVRPAITADDLFAPEPTPDALTETSATGGSSISDGRTPLILGPTPTNAAVVFSATLQASTDLHPMPARAEARPPIPLLRPFPKKPDTDAAKVDAATDERDLNASREGRKVQDPIPWVVMIFILGVIILGCAIFVRFAYGAQDDPNAVDSAPIVAPIE